MLQDRHALFQDNQETLKRTEKEDNNKKRTKTTTTITNVERREEEEEGNKKKTEEDKQKKTEKYCRKTTGETDSDRYNKILFEADLSMEGESLNSKSNGQSS